MKQVKITSNSYSDLNKVEEIFLEAFPPIERPPFSFLLENINTDSVDFTVYYDKDELIGFSHIVKYQLSAYLFFFAIEKSHRHLGYGRQILMKILERYKDYKFFLALERLDEPCDNLKQRMSRYEFYKSCGLKEVPLFIIEGDMKYMVMANKMIQPKDYEKIIDNFLNGKDKLVPMYMIEK